LQETFVGGARTEDEGALSWHVPITENGKEPREANTGVTVASRRSSAGVMRRWVENGLDDRCCELRTKVRQLHMIGRNVRYDEMIPRAIDGSGVLTVREANTVTRAISPTGRHRPVRMANNRSICADKTVKSWNIMPMTVIDRSSKETNAIGCSFGGAFLKEEYSGEAIEEPLRNRGHGVDGNVGGWTRRVHTAGFRVDVESQVGERTFKERVDQRTTIVSEHETTAVMFPERKDRATRTQVDDAARGGLKVGHGFFRAFDITIIFVVGMLRAEGLANLPTFENVDGRATH